MMEAPVKSHFPKLKHRIGLYNWKYVMEQNMKFRPSVYEEPDSDSSSPSEAEEYVDVFGVSNDQNVDSQKDYWKIKKMTKYFRFGNPTLSVMAVLCLEDCDFSNPITMQAVKDGNLVNRILNFLSSDHERLQTVSLRCVEKLGKLKNIRYEIVYFGGITPIVEILWKPNASLRKYAARAIARIAVFHRAWKIVRSLNGIPLLAQLLTIRRSILYSTKPLNDEEQLEIDGAAAAASALKVLCADRKSKKLLWHTPALPLCHQILKTDYTDLLIAIIGLLQSCATEKYFREEITRLGLLSEFKRYLYGDNRALTQICARTVFICAQDIHAREIFGERGFIEKIVEIINRKKNQHDEELMVSMSGALWKCSKSLIIVKKLNAINAIPLLLKLLNSPFLDVRVNIVGCIGFCFRDSSSSDKIYKFDGMDVLCNQMKITHPELMINYSTTMAEASKHRDCMQSIMESDTIRHIWSYLRTDNPRIIWKVGWSLCPILENMEDSASFVRSLIGGIELLMNLMVSKSPRLSTPACAIVTILCKQMETLLVFTEYGIVQMLIKQAKTARCEALKHYLCLAISACCELPKNLKMFYENGMVQCLLNYLLHVKHPEVRGAACRALYKFASHLNCCVMIYNTTSAIPIIIDVMNANQGEVQECAAGILHQIRLFSLYRETILKEYFSHELVDSKGPII